MIKNIIDFKNDKILFLILWFLMNKKCIVNNEKIKKVRNNGWEKFKFIE